MRIAVITNDYIPDSKGGAGVVAGIQVQELGRRGHELKVWRRPPASGLLSQIQGLKPDPQLVADVLSWKPTFLMTHNLSGCGLATPQTISRQGIRWVHMLHDVQLIDPSGQIVSGEPYHSFWSVCRFGWSRIARFFFGTPAMVISPTRWLLRMHRSYGFFRSSKFVVIPNPLVLPDPHRTPSDQHLLYIGRLDADKGIDDLVAAWKALGPGRPALHIIGEGSRRPVLEKMNDSRIIFHGQVARGDIPDFLQKQPVVVVPSRVLENQPTVLLEALAFGCRVVATDIGGIPETLGNAGWIVPPANPVALAGALDAALHNRGDLASRETARHEILVRHRVDVSVDALESVLRSNV